MDPIVLGKAMRVCAHDACMASTSIELYKADRDVAQGMHRGIVLALRAMSDEAYCANLAERGLQGE